MLTIDIAEASKVDLITKNNLSVQIIAILIILLSSLSYIYHYFIIIIVYLIIDIIITFFASLRSSKPRMPYTLRSSAPCLPAQVDRIKLFKP